MGWPAKKSDKEIKEGELAELKKKVAALEKELRVSSLPSLAHKIIRVLRLFSRDSRTWCFGISTPLLRLGLKL